MVKWHHFAFLPSVVMEKEAGQIQKDVIGCAILIEGERGNDRKRCHFLFQADTSRGILELTRVGESTIPTIDDASPNILPWMFILSSSLA